MGGICGWIGPSTRHVPGYADIGAMVERLVRFDGGTVSAAELDGSAVAVGAFDSKERIHSQDGLAVAVAGQLRFVPGELEDMRLERGRAAALWHGYRKHGPDVMSYARGAFALAVVQAGGQGMLAVDRAGIHPLAYVQDGERIVFGSSADAIRCGVCRNLDVDPQAIFDYLYFHMVPAPTSIYRGMRRLLPGEYAIVTASDAVPHRYWTIAYDEATERPMEELKTEFRAVLEDSIRSSIDGTRVGAFLSGGTDSSTVAGMLGKVIGAPAATYSIGFEADGYDEMAYARIAARHFATDHHEYYVTPDDVVDAIPQVASVFDQPYGNSSAVPAYLCARIAREDGIELMLGGDGGDELFGGNARYAKQHVYGLYGTVPAWLRRGVIEPVTKVLPASGAGPLSTLRNYVKHASMPMPGRLEAYNLLQRMGVENVLSGEFLSTISVDRPQRHLEAIYNASNANSLINRMLALDARITLADNDLPKVVRACELARVDVAFPLLQDELVAFSTRLAPKLKLKGTRLRYFFKEALRGFLPDEIIAKRKHGFGLPFGVWLGTHRRLREIAHDNLTALKSRGIVRPQFIDELQSRFVAEHAGYYGTMIWVLMMLEMWLEQRQPEKMRATY